jgi:uncharacterized protein YqeY
MSLEEKVFEDLKQAMRDRDALKLEVMRSVKSQLKYYQIEKKLTEITDQDVLHVIQKGVKSRQDSFREFSKAGRMDLADKEKAEMDILKVYLPEALSDEALEKIVKETILELKATDIKAMGQVMKAVLAKAKGCADGRRVNELVRASLGS